MRYLTSPKKPFAFTYCERRVTDGKRIPVLGSDLKNSSSATPHGHHAARKSLGRDEASGEWAILVLIRVRTRARSDLIMAILLFM